MDAHDNCKADEKYCNKIWVIGRDDAFTKCFNEVSAEMKYFIRCKFFHHLQWDTIEEKLFDLQQMQLFLVLVTKQLLKDHDADVAEEIAFAQKEGIPMLPILLESGLDELYRKKFGRCQYLDRVTQDETAVPYLVKLRNYLQKTLVSDDLANAIQDDFDAHVFLSYRKKDRFWANRLLYKIHMNEIFRDVGFFYDEFLNPGEDFEETLMGEIRKCQLFTLLVTPSIIDKGNYVREWEYKKALEYNKPLLPVEAIYTKRKKLVENGFVDIPICVSLEDNHGLAVAFQEGLKGVALRQNTSPRHEFLMGLAYINGIGVEIDRYRGFQLVTEAALHGEKLAIAFLKNRYWAETGLPEKYLRETLAAEKQLSCSCQALKKKFFLLIKAAKGYVALTSPVEEPSFVVEIAAQRAEKYFADAIQLEKQLPHSNDVQYELSRAHLHLSALTDDVLQKMAEFEEAICIAGRLSDNKKTKKNLYLLAEVLGCSLNIPDAVDNKTAKKVSLFYRTNLPHYVEVLKELCGAEDTYENGRRYYNALCRCAELYSREKDTEKAMLCYNVCIDIGKKWQDSRMVLYGAGHLAKIYSDQEKPEMTQK